MYDTHKTRGDYCVLQKNCSSLKGKTQRSAVGAPLTLTHLGLIVPVRLGADPRSELTTTGISGGRREALYL